MGDLRFIDLGQEWLGVKSFTLELMIYATAMFVCALIPRAQFPVAARAAILMECAAFVASFFVPNASLLPVYLVNAFAYGICFGYALLHFFFSLNNAERLFALILAVLYYLVCVEWLWQYDAARIFFIRFLPFIPLLLLASVYFTPALCRLPITGAGKQERISGGPISDNPSGGEDETDDAHVDDIRPNPIGTKGMTVVFLIYVIYTVVERRYTYVVYETLFVTSPLMVFGGLVAIAFSILIQFILNRNIWISWNVFPARRKNGGGWGLLAPPAPGTGRSLSIRRTFPGWPVSTAPPRSTPVSPCIPSLPPPMTR
jgi:hypothetical protein